MAMCDCGGSIRGKGRGYCATCRKPGPAEESSIAVLGRCGLCNRKLRGNGAGYCPSGCFGKCLRGASGVAAVPVEEPDDAAWERRQAKKAKEEAKKKRKALRKERRRLKRLQREQKDMRTNDRDANAWRDYMRERMRMFDNDPQVARRRCAYLCVPVVEE